MFVRQLRAIRLSVPITRFAKMFSSQPKLVVVSGVASGSGKTTLAAAVISYLRRAHPTSAVKITVTHGEQGCPHGGKSCNVCSSLGGDYQIISRCDVIEQPGTDTAKFVGAGASPVLWCISKDVAIESCWREVAPTISASRFVVAESNTLAIAGKPDLNLMIVDPTVSRRLWKGSATRLIASADLVLFNERGESARRAATLAETRKLRGEREVTIIEHPSAATGHVAVSSSLDALS